MTDPGRTVLVLGAGFSRAVSERMPITDELGNACLAIVPSGQGVPGEFTGGTFETWLSSVAEPQPYLREAENVANQHLFVIFRDAIDTVLGQRVDEVLRKDPPAWLEKFVVTAHATRSTIVTFNYDTLVEAAVQHRQIYEAGLAEPVAWTELTGDVPGWPSGVMRFAATPADTLRLLKLHGSLNWYWSPDDSSGLSVARRPLPGTFRASEPYTEHQRRRDVPGRVPFIVPPSATKSGYYQNVIVREMWRQASEALEAAHDVTFIGYSLPETDVTVSSMLRRQLPRGRSVHVVDLYPEGIVQRIVTLGVTPGRVTSASGEHAVADWAQAWCRTRSRAVLEDLWAVSESQRRRPLLVGGRQQSWNAVTDFRVHNHDLVLVTEPAAELGQATRRREAVTLPTVGTVLDAAPDGAALLLDDGTSRQIEVVASAPLSVETGYGNGDWLSLTPTLVPQ